MGLIFRTTNSPNTGPTQVKNAALTYQEGDGNFSWLATNLSGSSVSITGSVGLVGNLNVSSGITGSLFGTSSWAVSASWAPGAIAVSGSSIYSFDPPTSGFNQTNGIFLGDSAGLSATNAENAIFLGQSAGENATAANNSNFMSFQAGKNATNALYSNFFGPNAGLNATNASASNFIGLNAGLNATNADNSVFIGQQTGLGASAAAYSTFIGYKVGSTNSPGSNNIIIGTNISVAGQRRSSINIGGIIFGTGSYSTITGSPFSGSVGGRIGINVPTPSYNLDVSGSFRVTDGQSVLDGYTQVRDILNLEAQNPLPAGSGGDLAVSGSGSGTVALYFHDSTQWREIQLI